MLGLAVAAAPGVALGQSWADNDTRPVLRDIVAVDETGEPRWPYGFEDIAGNGGDFPQAEAAVDVRTVYARADSGRVFVRAYTSDSAGVPAPTTTLFIFVDIDQSPNTGGSADAPAIDPALDDDPTAGGFERAIVAQADGSRAEVWSWDSSLARWNMVTVQADELLVESGAGIDPIGIGSDTRGYLQADLVHALSGLTASCQARLFVRTFDADLGYGDLNAGDANPCEARDVDNDGTPDIIEATTVGCQSDADCPGDGLCLDNGACLIGVECVDNGDCASGYTCSGSNVCVRVVTAQCSDDADCGGQLCDAGTCRPCTSDAACGGDLVCAPNGECIDPGTVPPPDPDGGGVDPGDDGPFGEPGVEVQGGACTCRQGASVGASMPLGVLLALSAALALLFFVARPTRPRPATVRRRCLGEDRR